MHDVHGACLCPYSISICMSILHVHVHDHAAHARPFCMSVSKLHIHVHGPWPCPCCVSMFMSMLHVRVPVPIYHISYLCIHTVYVHTVQSVHTPHINAARLPGDVSTGVFRPIVPEKFRKDIFCIYTISHTLGGSPPGVLCILLRRFVWRGLANPITASTAAVPAPPAVTATEVGSLISPPSRGHQSSGGDLWRPVLLASACTCCTRGYGTLISTSVHPYI